mgnify:FL=1
MYLRCCPQVKDELMETSGRKDRHALLFIAVTQDNPDRANSFWNPVRPSHGWWVVAVCFSVSTALVGFSTYTFGLFGYALTEQFRWRRTQINASLFFSTIGTLLGPLLRAALSNLIDWCEKEVELLPSKVPSLGEGTAI